MPTYGGGPNPPVRLDMWQNIIEVGWPTDGPLGVAFQVTAAQTAVGSAIVPAGDYPARGPEHVASYLTAAGIWVTGRPLDGEPNYYTIRPIGGGAECTVTLSGADGLPGGLDPVTLDYGAWAFGPLGDGVGYTARLAQFATTGTGLDVSFTGVSELDGAPVLRNVLGPWLGAREYAAIVGEATAPGPSLDFSGITATEAFGGTRSFVAAQLSGVPDDPVLAGSGAVIHFSLLFSEV